MTTPTTTTTTNWWDDITSGAGTAWDWLTDGGQGSATAGAIGAGILGLTGGLDGPTQKPAGYQGGIPNYTFNRQQLQHDDAGRRPGGAGRRYFTEGSFSGGAPMQGVGLPQNSGGAAGTQPAGSAGSGGPAGIAPGEPAPGTEPDVVQYAEGGLASLMEAKQKPKTGRHIRGATDGMADKRKATIDGEEPAMLSDGEFVIPADVVSHLGNGNTDAGVKALEAMLAKIRKERTGNDKQGKQIVPDDFMPV